MDTKGVITLIFIILILATGLGIAISKYIQQKKKYEDYDFSKFISDYGANILALLKDVYDTYIKDTTYISDNDLIKDLINHGIDTIKNQCAKYNINSDIIKILSEDTIKEIITKIAIEFKDQIINTISTNDNIITPTKVPEYIEETHNNVEEPEVIEDIGEDKAEEMINLTNEFKTYFNENDYKYSPAVNENNNNDTVDI